MNQINLNTLYETWMNAEVKEQAALLLHQGHNSVGTLALYEQAVESVEAAEAAYLTALASAADELEAGKVALV